MVTGPSLIREIFIIAPKEPRPTDWPRLSENASQKASYRGSASSGARRFNKAGTVSFFCGGVEGELTDDEG